MKKKAGIYLCGAPGSGKSALAKRLAQDLSGLLEGEIEIIDEYTDEVERLGYKVAGEGAYLSNMVIYSEHRHAEDLVRMKQNNFITCGGGIERLAHAGVRTEVMNAGVKTPENDMRVMKEMQTATMFSFLLADTFAYSFVFYLPRRESVLLPGEDHKEPFYKRVDFAIRTTIDKFRVPAFEVEGTIDEQVEKVKAIIEETFENAAKAKEVVDGSPDNSGDNPEEN